MMFIVTVVAEYSDGSDMAQRINLTAPNILMAQHDAIQYVINEAAKCSMTVSSIPEISAREVEIEGRIIP